MTSFYIPHQPGPIFNRTIYINYQNVYNKVAAQLLMWNKCGLRHQNIIKKVCSHFRLAIKKNQKKQKTKQNRRPEANETTDEQQSTSGSSGRSGFLKFTLRRRNVSSHQDAAVKLLKWKHACPTAMNRRNSATVSRVTYLQKLHKHTWCLMTKYEMPYIHWERLWNRK